MISVASDCAQNKTGRYQGAAKRFNYVYQPGIYHILCAAQQLELVMQSLMTDVI